MDSMFDGFLEWTAGQYDSETGGFYYAASSVRDARFHPDIESTAQALNILQRERLADVMPARMREKLIRFFQRRQQPGTGYFLDGHPAMAKDEVMVQRALRYAVGALAKLGSSPIYPLPLHAGAAPDYVRSPESYIAYWRSIDLRNSWRGCDRLATSCMYMEDMPEEDRQPFLRESVHYLAEAQDKETGLWGEGSFYVRLSGAFKLHTFYSRFGLPMPRTDRIYASLLHALRHEEATDMCYIRNPIDLLAYMKIPIPSQELTEIVEITIANMTRLRRQDGGFSRELAGSPPAPNVAQVKQGERYPGMPEPVCLGRGFVEGDMNAGTQAALIRCRVYALAGLSAGPLPQADRFYSSLRH
ncbi:hypothetical protein DUZ99_15340 [Xylanibacillus composti]|nr:hypothetical protein [Xylanibacillus composti]